MDSRRHALCARKVSRRGIGERIGAALQGMSVVASEPLPTNVEQHIQVDQLHPEVSVRRGEALGDGGSRRTVV